MVYTKSVADFSRQPSADSQWFFLIIKRGYLGMKLLIFQVSSKYSRYKQTHLLLLPLNHQSSWYHFPKLILSASIASLKFSFECDLTLLFIVVAYLLGFPILDYSLDIGKEHVNLINDKLEKLIYSGQLDSKELDRYNFLQYNF